MSRGHDDAFRSILERMYSLLARHAVPQSETVRKALDVVDSSDGTFEAMVSSVDVWGGAGSIADLYLQPPADGAELDALLGELIVEIRAHGIVAPWAERRANIFLKGDLPR